MGAREELMARISAAKDKKETDAQAEQKAAETAEQQRKDAEAAEAAKQEHMANLHDRVRSALHVTGERLVTLTASAQQKREALLSAQKERISSQSQEDEELFAEAAAVGDELGEEEKNEVTQESRRAIKGETKDGIKAAHAEWKGAARDAKLIESVSEAFGDMTDVEKLALDTAIEDGNLTEVAKVSQAYNARTAERRKAEETALAEKKPEALMAKMNALVEEAKGIEVKAMEKWDELSEVSNKLRKMVEPATKVVDAKFQLTNIEAYNLRGEALKQRRDQHYAEHRATVAEALHNPMGEELKAQYQELRQEMEQIQARIIEISKTSRAASKLYLEQTAKPTGHSAMMGMNFYAQADLDKIPQLPDIIRRGVETDPLSLRGRNEADISYIEKSDSFNPSPDPAKNERSWTSSYHIVNPGVYNIGLSEVLKQE